VRQCQARLGTGTDKSVGHSKRAANKNLHKLYPRHPCTFTVNSSFQTCMRLVVDFQGSGHKKVVVAALL